MSLNYKQAGVDVEAGEALVKWIQKSPHGKKHHQANIVSGIGGFASLFKVDFSTMKNPCLVTCTDGVGTKVKLGAQFRRWESLGQDLVAMCVNDMICCGGVPLLFLDYYATGKLDLEAAQSFLLGVQKACDESLCALVGGETAEMPSVYHEGDFDCAGFAVGVVDKDKALGAHLVKKGNRLIGVSSNGFHSNGYSLLRKVFAQDMDKWIDYLMQPTHLYVQLAENLKKENLTPNAIAHMTGEGIENLPRVIPENLAWKLKSWQWPEPFLEVQRRTKMSDGEMLRTLNCGVGLILIVDPLKFESTIKVVKDAGYDTFDVGEMIDRKSSEEEIII